MALTIIPERKPSIGQYNTLFVSFDQHKEPIAVTYASEDRSAGSHLPGT
jgi:hypothetical protein